MLTQTAVFTRLVGDHMGPPPLVVAASDTCCEVVERLRSTGVSEVIVADGKGRALGIVTEQDVSRRIACSDSDDSPIESVMSSPVFSIFINDYLYHAIARMRTMGFRHMPVVDQREKVMAVLRLHQVMAVAAAPKRHGYQSRLAQDSFRVACADARLAGKEPGTVAALLRYLLRFHMRIRPGRTVPFFPWTNR